MSIDEPKQKQHEDPHVSAPADAVLNLGTETGYVPTSAQNQSGRSLTRPVGSVATASLLSITQQLHAIELSIIESGGEISAELEEALSVAKIAQERKVDAYDAVVKRCASVEAEYKAKADMLYSVADAAKKLATRLRHNVKLAMKQMGVTDLSGDSVRFKLMRGRQKVVVYNQDLLPGWCFRTRTITEPDLNAIQDHILNGVDVPGAHLIGGDSLRTYPVTKGELK